MSTYFIKNVNLKFKSKIIAAAKCISIDYNLKRVENISFNARFGFGLQQTVVRGLTNPLLVATDLIAVATVISPPARILKIDWACLGPNWKPNETYRFVFEQDFLREASGTGSLRTSNVQFEETYTTNPVPALLSRDPLAGPDAVNNTKIEFVFDRLMRPGQSGKINLFEQTDATDVLVKQYDIIMDVTQSNNVNNLSTFTLETTGLLKSNTTYFVTTDAKVFRDFDELYFPKLDAGDYVFTTDTSESGFPDLISFQMSGASLALAFIRYRNFDVALDVQAELTPDTFFSRIAGVVSDPVGEFEFAAVSNFTWRPTLNFESTSAFVSAVNYTSNGGSSLFSDFDQVSTVGVIKPLLASLFVYANLPNVSYIRYRNFNISVNSIFNQEIFSDYGMLDSTRTAIPTNGTLSGGPLLSDNRGPNFPLRYKLEIVGQIPSAVSFMSVQSAVNNITENNTLLGSVAGTSGDNFASGSQFGWDTYFSRDGTMLAARSLPDTGLGTIRMFTKSGNTWSQVRTITDVARGTTLSLNKNGTKVAASQTVYDFTGTLVTYSIPFSIQSLNAEGDTLSTYNSSNNSVNIYSWDGTAWNLQATINQIVNNEKFGQTSSLSDDGNTIAIGAPGVLGGLAGSIYIFTRTGSVWTQQAKLEPSNGYSGDRFSALSISLSGDGKTVTAGTQNSVSTSGSIFSNNSGEWLEEFVFPVRCTSVKLSTLGDVLIVTEPDNPDTLKIYTRSESSWTVKHTVSLPFGGAFSVAVDGDGTDFAYGYPGDAFDGKRGRVTTFRGPGCIANFSNTTRVLTITGEKQTISNILDSLSITKSDSPNFDGILEYLIYTATRPDGFISIRFQYA